MLFERQGKATGRQLRQFAVALMVFTLLAMVRLWWRHGSVGTIALSLSGISLALGVAGAVSPPRIRWLFTTVTAITLPIGLLVSELMLAVLYFAVITPMAMALRAVGRDPLDRGINRDAPTYWVRRRNAGDASRYFRQS
jgi:hypothetical protein